jgi:UDP-N-acetylmuramoyl-tripeptide--D-alanyl-D-alanine ligase
MSEPLWTLGEIAAVLGQSSAALSGDGVTGVSIDSRTLEPGDLFAAIKGDRMDGHKFVEAALEKGAAAAIVSDDYAQEPASLLAGRLFRVPDTLEGLNALARAARSRSNAKIVGVTGSVGKTGTKEMLRTMLGGAGKTHASEKSYNNLWGVPLSLARLPQDAQFGVFEMGMNHAGEITPLTKMVRPHMAMVTWVAPVHIEFFQSVADIADAKAEIFEGLEQGGAAILPADNEHFERLAAQARRKHAQIVAFGERESADARLVGFEPLENGSRVTADILGERIVFELGAPGRHIAANATGALAAVKLLGGEAAAAAGCLASFEAPEGRGRRTRFETQEGPVLIIDETYNANPASMRAALQVLGSIPHAKYARRIAILGDMLELGHGSQQFHAELAAAIDLNAIDLVFCAGELMEHLYAQLPPHKRGGLSGTSEELRALVLETVRGSDAVMIKGSLGAKMGLLADALRAHFAQLAGIERGRTAA